MILNHVADRAGLIIESAPTLDPESFRHGDLDGFDMLTVPDRLQGRVCKAEEKHIMDRLLPKIMIDAKDRFLIKSAKKNPVEFPGRGEVPAKGFFDNNASAFVAIRFRQLFHDQTE